MYAGCFKRAIDLFLSLTALLLLSPLLLMLTVIGAVAMKGNPFFVQRRPGRIDRKTGQERIIPLLKFRTMSNARDAEGKLLPDDRRLNRYGRFLRSTSLDELPSLLNILAGHLAICGPRPLLVEYLPYYTEEERHRHDVRPGLTGWAQVNGRNSITWEQKFAYDLAYIQRISLWFDLKIIGLTLKKVVSRSDILVGSEFKVGKFIDQRKARAAGETADTAADETEILTKEVQSK